MGSHTNVNIPTVYCHETQELLNREILETRLKFYKDNYEWLLREVANIPKALDEWGYVDLRVGNDTVRIVKSAPKGPNDGDDETPNQRITAMDHLQSTRGTNER